MVHSFGGILFNFKKELFSETTLMNCGNTVVNNRPVTTGRKCCDPTYRRSLGRSDSWRQKESSGCQSLGGGEEEFLCSLYTEFQFGKMKEFWRWMVVMFIWQWGSA